MGAGEGVSQCRERKGVAGYDTARLRGESRRNMVQQNRTEQGMQAGQDRVGVKQS